VTIKKSVPHSQETDRHKEMDKTILDNNTELNEIKNPIIGKFNNNPLLSKNKSYKRIIILPNFRVVLKNTFVK